MSTLPSRATRTSGHAPSPTGATGGFVELAGDTYYRIHDLLGLDPFLMNLPTDTDLWMFVTSNGGLTAGRVDAAGSVFPYLTSDQLHDAHHHTGPITVVRVETPDGGTVLWEPFTRRDVERNLYKNVLGNRLIFEEIDHGLALAFRYRWCGCDPFGWVRTATLENLGPTPRRVTVLDGLRNLLPHGAPLRLYQRASNLVDAYKVSEVDAETGLGIFSLSAGITDRAEALEVLRANTVWCGGLERFDVHLSLDALEAFRQGMHPSPSARLTGRRGNYLDSFALALPAGAGKTWHLAVDEGRDQVQIADLRRRLRAAATDPSEEVEAALASADRNLRRIVGSADGLQHGGRPESTAHHLANVLYNVMRGGVFADNHDCERDDFVAFLGLRNRDVAARHAELLASWPARLTVDALRARALAADDPDLARLSHEYLPLYFGRRHGDPSRPWNDFEIRMRDRDGRRRLHYEGNWRDIFQNWEGLATAFPAFLPSMVATFVNASTVDGFNPYRLTRDGIDWEVPEPEDPWSNIGYWGDHQIVYLLKLLEALDAHDPHAFSQLLAADIFSYADVPYRLKPYASVLADASDTIEFDDARAAAVAARVAARGADGKLRVDDDGRVVHVNLLEKLLVPALSKLSNLVPDAGIWMNTQRPEWNDANNALAGGGVSVVTLCYLRRYLVFLARRLESVAAAALPVSCEIADWFARVAAILAHERAALTEGRGDPLDRKRIMDALGQAFSAYRAVAYERGLSGRRALPLAQVRDLCRTALAAVDASIAANRREDGLYHAYNLLEFAADGARVSLARLPEMLEGQVAALSSGLIAPAEALELLDQLYASDLYDAARRSFLLYPARPRPDFLERNAITRSRAVRVGLLRDLLTAGDTSLVAVDADGVVRFNGDVAQAADIDAILARLAGHDRWADAVARDADAVRTLFEEVFRHHSYTGRSGVMYGYEGLGCIYWHMVAKLLLAVQELVLRDDLAPDLRDDLARMYIRVRSGIGYEKTAAEYGAFPTDPYSHTPPGGGAKQPGMTGQVKEEILTRGGELGIGIDGGTVRFAPVLLQDEDFTTRPETFAYVDLAGREQALPMPAGSLAFTLCQTPVLYVRTAGEAQVRVTLADGTTATGPGAGLDPDTSARLLQRRGGIAMIEVGVPERVIRRA
ncbi:MAG: hypothetical protein R3D98_02575 [Candidatus Krumholzibacteriia bacterium]